MNIEEIKKNAPHSADFYLKDDEVRYFKAISGWWYEWINMSWCNVNSLVMQQYRDDLRRLYPCR